MSYTAAVITVSDKASRGERVDTSGPAVRKILEDAGFAVVHTSVVPDETEQIQAELISCADEKKISLIMTTGGTGFSPRDVTPEASLAVIERETRGIPEAMRWASLQITPPRLPEPQRGGHPGQQPDREPARQRKGRKRKPACGH